MVLRAVSRLNAGRDTVAHLPVRRRHQIPLVGEVMADDGRTAAGRLSDAPVCGRGQAPGRNQVGRDSRNLLAALLVISKGWAFDATLPLRYNSWCTSNVAHGPGGRAGGGSTDRGPGSLGKKALVTAGSRGIGRAVVERLVAEGMRVAICARNAAGVELATKELGPHGDVVASLSTPATIPRSPPGSRSWPSGWTALT